MAKKVWISLPLLITTDDAADAAVVGFTKGGSKKDLEVEVAAFITKWLMDRDVPFGIDFDSCGVDRALVIEALPKRLQKILVTVSVLAGTAEVALSEEVAPVEESAVADQAEAEEAPPVQEEVGGAGQVAEVEDTRPPWQESHVDVITEHLVKPVMRADLLKTILKVLGQPSQVSASDQPALSGGMPLRILLAEDNPINQKVGVRLLERQGHSVVLVSTGVDALEAFGRESFDVILMDIQMPVMDGYDATRAIRARERSTGGHVPVIALTAHAMHDDRQTCMDAGMDDYLSKPIQTRELCKTLARWTDTAIAK